MICLRVKAMLSEDSQMGWFCLEVELPPGGSVINGTSGGSAINGAPPSSFMQRKVNLIR